MANISAALSGLAAAYPGMLQGRIDNDNADLKDLQLGDAKRDAAAKIALGNALQLLSANPQPQAPPPGQASQPAAPPPQMGAPQPQQMMMPPGGAPQPQQAPPGMPPRPMMPPSAPPPVGGGGPPQVQPMGVGGAPGGMPSPGGPPRPPGMGQSGQMDWRQLVAAVKQANPDIQPDVLMQAVNQFLPLMNQQSQQEWRQVSLQIREQQITSRESQLAATLASREREGDATRNTRRDIAGDQEAGRDRRTTQLEEGRNTRADLAADLRREAEEGRNRRATVSDETRRQLGSLSIAARREIADQLEAGRDKRATMSSATKQEIAKLHIDARRELTTLLEEGRNTRADEAEAGRNKRSDVTEEGRNTRATAARDQRQDQFEQREARLEKSLKLREDSTWARLEQQKTQAIERARQSGDKQALAQARAIIEAQDKHVRTRIQAYSLNNQQSKTERAAMLKEADEDYARSIESLKTAAAPASTSGQKPPQQGDEVDGYRFKGGNPADRANWEKIVAPIKVTR